MHDKNGRNPYNTRFKHIAPHVYFALMLSITENLDSIEEYESLIDAMSERARGDVKNVISTFDENMSPAEKVDLLKVYLSLKGPESEPPF